MARRKRAAKRQQRANEKIRQERLRERRRRISARAKPPLRDCVWAAGHFEGEGTVSITSCGHGGYSRPVVTLASTDPDVIDFFQAIWPGRVDSYEPSTGRGRSRTAHRWTLFGQDAIECCLLDMRPHLKTPRVRRKVALLLDDIRDRVHLRRTETERARKLARRALMRELNRRGVRPSGEAE